MAEEEKENNTKNSIISILSELIAVANDIKEKKNSLAHLEVDDINKLNAFDSMESFKIYLNPLKAQFGQRYQKLYADDTVILKGCNEIIESCNAQINVLNNIDASVSFNKEEYKQRVSRMLQLIENIIKLVKEDDKFDVELIEQETSLSDSLNEITQIMKLIDGKTFASQKEEGNFKDLYKKDLYENLVENLSKNLNLAPIALTLDFHEKVLLDEFLIKITEDKKKDFNDIIPKVLNLNILDYYEHKLEEDKYFMKSGNIVRLKKDLGDDFAKIIDGSGERIMIEKYKKQFDETKTFLDSIKTVLNNSSFDDDKKVVEINKLYTPLDKELTSLIKFLEENKLEAISTDGKKKIDLKINIEEIKKVKTYLELNLGRFIEKDTKENKDKIINEINNNINYFYKEIFNKL